MKTDKPPPLMMPMMDGKPKTSEFFKNSRSKGGRRLTERTQLSTKNYVYDNANRLTSAGGGNYTWDANGNLLNDGVNAYTYDSFNRLSSVNGTTTYTYNGLGDRLTQNGVHYTLDLNAGLTQVLDDGTNVYTYGLGRISQTDTSTEYFLGDALGSVRQLANAYGEVTLTKHYDPYGNNLQSLGTAQTDYGFTGETTDANGLIYLRARYYASNTGRFLSRDTWAGNHSTPISLNKWVYAYSNPINNVDPSGNSPETTSQILGQTLPQGNSSSSGVNILALVTCAPTTSSTQYDLTGYLAEALTKHGQDGRVKVIAASIALGEVSWAASKYLRYIDGTAALAAKEAAATAFLVAYIGFFFLEAPGMEWDIKKGIKRELDDTEDVVLCGTGNNCDWFNRSALGNIHFGYVAGLSLIDHYVAAVAGGAAQQKDVMDNFAEQGIPYNPIVCFLKSSPDRCDDPQDQAAVDFGYKLAKKYGSGMTDAQLRAALNGEMGNFQRPPSSFSPPHPAYPEDNYYDADEFNN
jgi:RHS repeat-associated protein